MTAQHARFSQSKVHCDGFRVEGLTLELKYVATLVQTHATAHEAFSKMGQTVQVSHSSSLLVITHPVDHCQHQLLGAFLEGSPCQLSICRVMLGPSQR